MLFALIIYLIQVFQTKENIEKITQKRFEFHNLDLTKINEIKNNTKKL